MRKEYLKSVLRQDVGFFDTNAVSSTTYDVVTAITADAYVIQDVLSDKVNLSFFLFQGKIHHSKRRIPLNWMA